LEYKAVKQAFVRVAPIWNVHVGKQIIRTTAEHPFYVLGKSWIPAALLEVGDLLSSHDGEWLPVEGVADSGEVTTVYNFEVEEYHTYFVGREDWGFSVWVHNGKPYNGDTRDTRRGKDVHGKIAQGRRDAGIFDVVDGPIRDSHGRRVEVPYRVDLETGLPRASRSKKPRPAFSAPEPDAVYRDGSTGVIIDDKPIGGSLSKYRQQLARQIIAYETAYGEKPTWVAITRYNPRTGKPMYTELYRVEDIAPFLR
jgi:hypothetical protein